MSEESASAIPEIAKELAPKLYEDVAHPALKATGELLGLLPRAILAKLTPLRVWILNAELQFREIAKLIEEKLKNVPPEQIETPEPYIAVPALQYISYCMDNHELRDMYANLLASSMNKVVKNGVHPGYVEIIKQLCPDEAKILRYIAEQELIPVIYVKRGNATDGFIWVVKGFSNAGFLTGCENPLDIYKYLNNLLRLGLIEFQVSPTAMHSSLADKQLYEPLKNHPYIQSIIKKTNIPEDTKNEIDIVESYASISDYGRGFCSICLNIPQATKTPGSEAIKSEPGIATDEEFDEMLNDIYNSANC